MATTAEYGIGEFTFPRGWFMVGETKDATNKPIPLRYFGRDLIMYRGESGRVVVMDAYCPHMKTHLAKNEVMIFAVPTMRGSLALTACVMKFLIRQRPSRKRQKFAPTPSRNGADLS